MSFFVVFVVLVNVVCVVVELVSVVAVAIFVSIVVVGVVVVAVVVVAVVVVVDGFAEYGDSPRSMILGCFMCNFSKIDTVVLYQVCREKGSYREALRRGN